MALSFALVAVLAVVGGSSQAATVDLGVGRTIVSRGTRHDFEDTRAADAARGRDAQPTF